MMAGARPAETSIRLLLDDVRTSGYRLTDAIADMGETFTDGSASLYEAIAKDVRGEIQMSAPVRRIAHDHDSVIVMTDEGRASRARRRPHPAAQLLGRRRRRSAVLATEDPCRDRGPRRARAQGGAACRGVSPGLFGLGFEAQLQSVIATKAAPRGTIVTGFDSMGRLIDPEDVAEPARHSGATCPKRATLGVITHDWVADPWSKGAYVAPRPGWAAEVVPALPVPEGRLAFAGLRHRARGRGLDRGRDLERTRGRTEAARIARN